MKLRSFLPVTGLIATLSTGTLVHGQLPQRPWVAPAPLAAPSVREAAHRVDEAALLADRERWETRQRQLRGRPGGNDPYVLPEVITDEVFLRRLYLDLQARNPEPDLVRSFLVSGSAEKRSVAVDKALDHPLSAARRFLRLADMLRLKDAVMGQSMHPYIEWLRQATAKNMPYDKLVHELITTTGDLSQAPAAGYLMSDSGKVMVTMQEMLRTFVDENIQCASCHDHPFADATQMQMYRLAAVLTQVQVVKKGAAGSVQLPMQPLEKPPGGGGGSVVDNLNPGEFLAVVPAVERVELKLPPYYYYRDGRPGEMVKPGLPAWGPKGWEGMRTAAPALANRVTKPCEDLAMWIFSSERFAEVAALRTWQELFGSFNTNASQVCQAGGKEATSPEEVLLRHSCEGSGPRKLREDSEGHFAILRDKQTGVAERSFAMVLARELVLVRYDLREFERILCNTQAYQRKAQQLGQGEWPRFIAPVFRRQTADAIWNNLVLVQTDGAPAGKLLMSQELNQVPPADHPIRLLGRSERQWGDDSLNEITHGLVVILSRGDATRAASVEGSPLVRRLQALQPGDLAVEEAFLVVLGRLPTLEEKMAALNYGVQNPGTVWSDVVWSLLNTSEFVFQY